VQLAHFFDLATALLVSYNIVQGGFFMKNEYYDTSLTMATHDYIEASSAAMKDELYNTQDIDSFLGKNKEHMIPNEMTEHLNMLLFQKDLKIPDIIRDSLLDKGYVYQIFSGRRKPSRDKMISLAFGMHLSDEETQKMLKISGFRELYVKDERDALILFSLHKNNDIDKTNRLLYDHDFKILGTLD
jgi:hypothetical protein